MKSENQLQTPDLSSSNIILIACTDLNDVIGTDGQLPWAISEDMSYFKDVTQGGIVIMGRNTWDSIPSKYRPLSNRHNFVVSGNKFGSGTYNGVFRQDSMYIKEGAWWYDHPINALKAAKQYAPELSSKIFIVGGSRIYECLSPYCDTLLVNRIQSEHLLGNKRYLNLRNQEESVLPFSQLSKTISPVRKITCRDHKNKKFVELYQYVIRRT